VKEFMARKNIIIAIVIAIAIIGSALYYFSHVRETRIEKILSNPKAYEEKAVNIEGEVTDRTAFFEVLKFFKVRDKTGEVIVVTKKSLPGIKSRVSVKGKINEAFSLGDQKLLVFVEESMEEKGKKK
jgi:hypothetical protein